MGKDKDPRRAQNVQVTQSFSLGSSLNTSFRPSRMTFLDIYSAAMNDAIELRKNHKIMSEDDDNIEDLTPPSLEDNGINKKLYRLNHKLRESDIWTVCPAREIQPQISFQKFFIGGRVSLDDSMLVTFASQLNLSSERAYEKSDYEEEQRIIPPYIKIVLKKTKEILLFEQCSLTVLRGSKEAVIVEEENKSYELITTGKGRIRRTTTSETQTINELRKSRDTNTQLMRLNTTESFVSNFEMFKSFKKIVSVDHITTNANDNLENSGIVVSKKSQAEEIFQKKEFKLALMTMLRLLAGNVYHMEQRRFRNLIMPDPMARNADFNYGLKRLLRFNPITTDRHRKSVADLTFCPGNGDIIAVAYGIYSFNAMHVPESGYCCVWNIKNPVNPERRYYYNAAVVSVQFSPFTPQLLAIGLYDGSVEIRDISTFKKIPVAVSLRTKTSTCDPILALEWMPQLNVHGADNSEIEPLLALSQDGSVTKYRIINSPYLLAFKQMHLDRIEGSPEGLPIQRIWNQTQSNRCPQGLGIKKHPSQHDVYYILTDEGCIHKCSTNYPHQHLQILQVHIGSVNDMDFSPWSPKLFLTAGNDWCIRIWIEGILEPLITLKHEIGPVHCAAWSKTHSTVIISNTLKTVSIWDIRRCTLKPISCSNVDKSNCTMFKFSRCGRSIALGNERGSVLVLGVEDMPFPPHFQYEELELAIYRAISTKPDLTTELKSIGFFGYPEQNNSRRKKTHNCTLGI